MSHEFIWGVVICMAKKTVHKPAQKVQRSGQVEIVRSG